MLHPFGQVNYFDDGTRQGSSRGDTVALFTTGSPLPMENFTAIPDFFSKIPGFGGVISNDWRLYTAQITQNRIWACSSAKFTLVCKYRYGQKLLLPPIHPEMPISIDLGYTDQLYSGPIAGGDVNLATNGTAEAWRTRRRFMGYIDTIQLKATSKRIIITVSCRDKIRFLIENRLVGFFNLDEMIAQANAGTAPNTEDNPTDLASWAKNNGGSLMRQEVIKALIRYGSGGGITDADLSVEDTPDKEGKWDFGNIAYSTRDSLDGSAALEGVSNSFIVMNKAPIEPLKRLSVLEATLPKELYADHNGKVHWREKVPTVKPALDYHLLRRPSNEELQKHHAVGDTLESMPIVAATVEFSTVGSINRFMIVNPQNAQTAGGANVIAAAGELNTDELYGFHMFPRTRFIMDETLKAGPDGNATAAVKPILEAEFMIWGKDIRGLDCEIIGNPSLYAGDPVRLHETPYFDPSGPGDHNIGLTRADTVIDQLAADGPKRGLKQRMLLTIPVTDEYSERIRKVMKVPSMLWTPPVDGSKLDGGIEKA